MSLPNLSDEEFVDLDNFVDTFRDKYVADPIGTVFSLPDPDKLKTLEEQIKYLIHSAFVVGTIAELDVINSGFDLRIDLPKLSKALGQFIEEQEIGDDVKV